MRVGGRAATTAWTGDWKSRPSSAGPGPCASPAQLVLTDLVQLLLTFIANHLRLPLPPPLSKPCPVLPLGVLSCTDQIPSLCQVASGNASASCLCKLAHEGLTANKPWEISREVGAVRHLTPSTLRSGGPPGGAPAVAALAGTVAH